MGEQRMLMYPRPTRPLRRLLRAEGWQWYCRGLWLVVSASGTRFTFDLDAGTMLVWPEAGSRPAPTPRTEGAVIAPLYGLFAAIGERLFAWFDPVGDGVLTGTRGTRVLAIRPCRRLHSLDEGPASVRRRAARELSALPAAWRLAPANDLEPWQLQA